ncbi:hypothetical protein [Maridesulfovibrio ferrireducens]|uniref:hypothetical protein n=1 Tax=Maridesulfovibrio ferrireducens TaxID=246191 RepID=UPI001A2EEC5D|nr:hypothetical protein [Maridesulfovibrio ferrireducens]MBI9112418.1 hypothetical protein [Maridesulfovibrio ferrireducens]MBI9113029.1 hypothetical protein [Maridesulfovibrio ferrireducens]
MKINMTIDLGDLGFDEDLSVEEILTDEIKKSLVKEVANKFGGKGISELVFKLSEQVATQVESNMRNKAESFMSEDIALTDKWGKATFIGSTEDLMRLKFDEAVLFPVNGNGVRLEMCSTAGAETWIQWKVRTSVEELLKHEIYSAKEIISREIKGELQDTLESYKDGLLKKEVTTAVERILAPSN